MSDADIEFPWVNYGAADKHVKDKMIELTTQSWSPFNEHDFATVFIFCMAYAFAKGKTPIPPPKGSGSMPPSAFKGNMRQLMCILAIAETGELKTIKKSAGKGGYVKICERYAFAGFSEVYNKIKNRDSSITAESVLNEMLNAIEVERDQA